jgi:O-antigen/teichoic acid export membrane protein
VPTGPYTRRGARAAAFHAVLLRVPAQAASLLGYVLLVRYLPESEFGVYSLLYMTLPVVGTLISFGLEDTLRRYQPEYLRKGENRLAHKLARRVSQLRLALALVFLAIVLIFWDTIAPFFKIAEYREHFLLFALLIVSHFQCQVLTLSLSAHLLQKYSVGLTAAFSILKLVGYGLAILIFEFDLWTAIVVDVLAYAIFLVGLEWAYARKTDRTAGKASRFEPQEIKRVARYAAYYSFNEAGTLSLDNRKDGLFLAALMDPISVGAYALANRFNEMIARATPTQLLESVIQPLFVSLDYKRDPDKIQRYFSLLMTIGLLTKVPVLAFTAVYHHEIVEVLFAGQFLEYSYLLAVVALFSVGLIIATPATLVAQLEEKAQVILASKIFGIYGIAASLLLIPRLGVLGAVIASGTSVLFKDLFIWWFVRDLARWKNAASLLGRCAIVWGIFAVIALPLQRWLAGYPAALLAIAFIAWCGFFLVQVRFVVAAEHKEIIRNMFSGREQRLLQLLGVA